MLQEAVDALFDNGRRGRPVVGPATVRSSPFPICSRASRAASARTFWASARTTPAVPLSSSVRQLKMHQCGLPKQMALELFKPFVMKRLVELEQAANIKAAKRMVDRGAQLRVGRARRGHHRPSRAAQPRTNPAPPRHPGLRAGARRGARPSACIRSSAPPSTPTSTATRWPCTCRWA